jgi:hypothetical protein
MGSRARPRHGRRPTVAGWAAQIAARWAARARAVRPARPPVHGDPLVSPVEITGHAVIGDQLRLPATWCDMPGCGAVFADPAALGEADNRAKATAAGWQHDAIGQLICPACQRDHRAAGQPRLPPPPATAEDHPPAVDPAGQAGRVSQPAPPATSARGRHRGAHRSHLLTARATDRTTRATTQPATIPRPRTSPDPPTGPAPPWVGPAGRPGDRNGQP